MRDTARALKGSAIYSRRLSWNVRKPLQLSWDLQYTVDDYQKMRDTARALMRSAICSSRLSWNVRKPLELSWDLHYAVADYHGM